MNNNDIFKIPEKPSTDEFFEILKKDGIVEIEKIVSYGIPSPKGFWYEQEKSEWVTILEGQAIIKYFDDSEINLEKGMSLFIPPMKKHRVEKVSNPCLWLAIKY